MVRFSKEKRAFILFLCFFLISALIITVDYHGKGFFGLAEDVGLLLIKPVNQLIYQASSNLNHYLQVVADIEKVREENELLRNQNLRMKQENDLMKEKLASYDRLMKMTQFKDYYSYDMIGAQVIGREPDNWFHSVVIDRGREDQVHVDMGVAAYNGLVGKII